MKYGVRKPSISKRVSARTTGKINRSIKKAVNPCYGKKGVGWINDPKRAAYNKIYNKTTIGVDDIAKACNETNRRTSRSVDDVVMGVANGIVFAVFIIAIIAICVIASWIF